MSSAGRSSPFDDCAVNHHHHKNPSLYDDIDDDEVEARSPLWIMMSGPQSNFQNASSPRPLTSNDVSNISENGKPSLVQTPLPASEESAAVSKTHGDNDCFQSRHSFESRLILEDEESERRVGRLLSDDHPRVVLKRTTIPELSSLHYRGKSPSCEFSARDNLNSLESTSKTDMLPHDDPQRVRFSLKDYSKFSVKEDIETGKEGARGKRVWARPFSTRMPQSAGARRRRGLEHFAKKLVNPFWGTDKKVDMSLSDHSSTSGNTMKIHGRLMVKSILVTDGPDNMQVKEHNNEHDMEADKNTQQYRLEAITRSNEPTARALGLSRNVGIYEDTLLNTDNCKFCGVKPNLMVIGYLHWAFRSSFTAVMISAAGVFFLLTIVFAMPIMGTGYRRPDCITVNGDPFGTGDTLDNFLDAYALSWTTFSTVGYGLIFPASSANHSSVKQCTFITVLTALESFVGILFSSMWGAIFFAKVTRVSSVAQVTFSDPLVLRYGAGVAANDEDSDSEEDINASDRTGGEDPEKNRIVYDFVRSKLSCPILEFRVVNRLHNERGGEIIEASMNIVASIDESQASDSLKNSVKKKRRRGKNGKGRGGSHSGGRRSSRASWIMPTKKNVARARSSIDSLISSSRNQTLEEDPSGQFISKKIFAKLELESQECPFFKRVWIVRHVLDHHSPLVRQDAKELIRLNKGNWPEDLNSAEAIRACVMFDQILVSLSGTSNLDASSVYCQQVYNYEDLCVGYRFCDMLYRQNDGSIGVDVELLNDVKEQRGGGGEDLHTRDKRRSTDFFAQNKDFIL